MIQMDFPKSGSPLYKKNKTRPTRFVFPVGVYDKDSEFTVEQNPCWINLCSKCQFCMTSVWQHVLNPHKVLFHKHLQKYYLQEHN